MKQFTLLESCMGHASHSRRGFVVLRVSRCRLTAYPGKGEPSNASFNDDYKQYRPRDYYKALHALRSVKYPPLRYRFLPTAGHDCVLPRLERNRA